MKQEPFVIEKLYDAPVAKVWWAITDKDAMKQWYFDLSAFKPEVGFEFRFTGNNEGKVYMHICRITEVIINKKLQYTWRYENYPGNSTVTFELMEEGNKTKLRLTHEGLETFPANDPSFARTSFAGGWGELIGNLLRAFLEKN